MVLSSATIIGSGKKRNAFDFYPTPKEVTMAFLNNIDWPKTIVVWEPACGENHMVNVLLERFNVVIGSDIQKGTDFLTAPMLEVDACVTNPPFTLSVEFIKKATMYPYAALLLKSAYWHSARRTKLFYARKPSKILCLNWRPQFTPSLIKTSPTMDFIWTIWEPYATNTEFIVCEKPNLKGML